MTDKIDGIAGAENQASYIWQKYQNAQQFSSTTGRFNKVKKYHDFYEGRQWVGAETGGEVLPTENFITPNCKFKVAQICNANVRTTFFPVTNEESPNVEKLCDNLNRLTAKFWEKNKMETRLWEIVKDGSIAGDAYFRFFDEDLKCELIDTTDIFFSDEDNLDIQENDWIIIKYRDFVSHIKDVARENGLSDEEISSIQPDQDTENELGEDASQEMDGVQKATCLLYMERNKETGYIDFARSVQNVIYEPIKSISSHLGGLRIYPIAPFLWERKKGSARGIGEVERLLDNQIAVNKTVATRYITAKINAYGKMVVNENLLNPEDIDKVGATLYMDGSVRNVNDAITYIQPCSSSPEAKNLTDEIRDVTRNLSGISEAALGDVNPEQASGYAIRLAADQASTPLSDQKAAFKETCESIGRIYKALLLLYRRDETLDGVGEFDEEAELSVRVDISSASLASRIAEDEILNAYLDKGYITFDERVEALTSSSTAPKGVLEKIIQKRREAAQIAELESGGFVPGDAQMPMQGNPYEDVSQFPEGY